MIAPARRVTAKSKTELVKDIYASPATYKNIGAAWFLFDYLLHVCGGEFNDNYNKLSESTGVPKVTLSKWASKLKKRGIASIRRTGFGACIKLRDRYLTAAQAPDRMMAEEEKVVGVGRIAGVQADDDVSSWMRQGLALKKKGLKFKATFEVISE